MNGPKKNLPVSSSGTVLPKLISFSQVEKDENYSYLGQIYDGKNIIFSLIGISMESVLVDLYAVLDYSFGNDVPKSVIFSISKFR